MQHGPSIYATVLALLILLGIIWLGERVLAKWHPVYAGKKVKTGYRLTTALAVITLIFSRWLRPADSFPGVWFRYLLYAAYIWLVGLVFLLLVLLLGHTMRILARRLRRKAILPQAATGPAKAGQEPTLTRRNFLQGALMAVPAVPFMISTYGVIGGDSIIVVNRHTLLFPQLPPALNGFTIAQISDTHMGNFFGMDKLERVLAMVKRERPDLLVITGDLVDDLGLLSPLINRLTAFHSELLQGIFFCWGNHEYFRDINRIRRALESSPVKVLANSHQVLTNGLVLAGVDYPWGNNKGEQEGKRRSYFAQAMQGIPADSFTVFLTHHPDFLDNAFAAKVPLSLAGHTHGGQVAFGGVSMLPVQYKYMRGMFRQDGCYGYVSVGTGHWLPLRIGCPAEISIFTLKKGMS
ncbi:metallophosphoesterase [Sporomusa acidovorans]|uniref:3',5'-cyclic adenosine monophosphate phosphodiesterase CpdA n=1 Tax=Sporomusa acidovorans (strain ATCC 49682 / DSM 3132 / Mol) TaxID=1123286 RepID=A0ABZ3IVI1_SPOA4|nr:metallophosphoesterase [Sporomusa acidovorans]OZC15268.1 putative metallophosphoesterase [Sporomusa acidovorans DSM 3132]SDE91661.1 hypothetical protein SAMN04488499_102641 [Sporomusa acidovorans]